MLLFIESNRLLKGDFAVKSHAVHIGNLHHKLNATFFALDNYK